MSLTCRLYCNGVLEETNLRTADISTLLRDPDALLWVDIERPTDRDMALLKEEFGFHELALEDSIHPHQRPKIESYGSYYFLVAYGATVAETEIVLHELSAFVSRQYLVTVRKEPVYDVSAVVSRWEAHGDLVKEGGGFLLYILLDEIVDGYFDALDGLEDESEEVEDRVLGQTETPAQQELLALKRKLLKFRRSTAPLRDVLDVLQRRMVDVVTVPLEPYYRDVYDHVLRVTDFLDTLRDIMSTSFEAYLSAVSNRLNEVMKVLTSWAAIILVPTLIAGIYGMNFRHMPELNWLLGYPMALGLMGASALLLYRMFKKRGWL